MVNSSIACEGVASSWELIAGRIGSTRPMPMKETVAAKAIAHTDFGWWNASRRVGAVEAGVVGAVASRTGAVMRGNPSRVGCGVRGRLRRRVRGPRGGAAARGRRHGRRQGRRDAG